MWHDAPRDIVDSVSDKPLGSDACTARETCSSMMARGSGQRIVHVCSASRAEQTGAAMREVVAIILINITKPPSHIQNRIIQVPAPSIYWPTRPNPSSEVKGFPVLDVATHYSMPRHIAVTDVGDESRQFNVARPTIHLRLRPLPSRQNICWTITCTTRNWSRASPTLQQSAVPCAAIKRGSTRNLRSSAATH
jgi:hypothetical protein